MSDSSDITAGRQIEEALRQSEAKYRRLHESMMDAFVSVDMSGRIQECNESYRQMLGYEPAELLTLRYPDITPEKWHAFEEAIVQEQILRRGYSDIYEKEYRRKDGTVFPIELRTFLIVDDGGRPTAMWAIVRDITERKRHQAAIEAAHDELEQRVKQRTAELTAANQELSREIEERRSAQQALAESEAKYRHLVEITDTGFLISDDQGRVIDANAEFVRITGHNALEEIVGRTMLEWTAPHDIDRNAAAFAQCLATGRVRGLEVDYIAADGRITPIEVNANVTIVDGERLVLALCRDITERRRAQTALERDRRTLKHMLRASDHERQLISYEIHDGLAQQIAGALMQIQTYSHQRSVRPDLAAKAFDAATTMLQQCHFEVRRLIAGVRPPVLDERGVVEAIAHLIHEQSRQCGLAIEFQSKVSFDRLPRTLENTVYRIAQEALANACRHSGSDTVCVRLIQYGERLRIEVQDWGVGFNTKAIHKNRFGLEGIRQRARLLGGKCRIRSAPGQGTRVLVELPVLDAE